MGLLKKFPEWTTTESMKIGFSRYSRKVPYPKRKSDAEKEVKAVKAFQAHVESKLIHYKKMSVEFGESYGAALRELLDRVPHVKDIPAFDTLFSEFQQTTIMMELQQDDDELTDANKISVDPQLLKELQLKLEYEEEKLVMTNAAMTDLIGLRTSASLLLEAFERDVDYFTRNPSLEEKKKRKRGGEGYSA